MNKSLKYLYDYLIFHFHYIVLCIIHTFNNDIEVFLFKHNLYKKKKKIKIDIFSSKVRQNKTSLHIRNVDNSKKTSTLASRFS